MTESRPQTIWEELPQEHNNKVVNFIKRLTVCVAASGDNFETICPSASLHPHPITNKRALFTANHRLPGNTALGTLRKWGTVETV